jgi:hypothetical protein
MTTITLKQLDDAREPACVGQRAIFMHLFGASVQVSVKLAEKHAQDFDFDWAARNLLSRAGLEKYEKARLALWADYDKARAPLFAKLYLEEKARERK